MSLILRGEMSGERLGEMFVSRLNVYSVCQQVSDARRKFYIKKILASIQATDERMIAPRISDTNFFLPSIFFIEI